MAKGFTNFNDITDAVANIALRLAIGLTDDTAIRDDLLYFYDTHNYIKRGVWYSGVHEEVDEIVRDEINDNFYGILDDYDINILYKASKMSGIANAEAFAGGEYEFWYDFTDMVAEHIGQILYGE